MKDSGFTDSSLRRILASQSQVCEGFCLHSVKFVKGVPSQTQVCEGFCLHKVQFVKNSGFTKSSL